MVENCLNVFERFFRIAIKFAEVFGVLIEYLAELCGMFIYKIIDRLAMAFGKVSLHKIPREYPKIFSFFAGREVVAFHEKSIPYPGRG